MNRPLTLRVIPTIIPARDVIEGDVICQARMDEGKPLIERSAKVDVVSHHVQSVRIGYASVTEPGRRRTAVFDPRTPVAVIR